MNFQLLRGDLVGTSDVRRYSRSAARGALRRGQGAADAKACLASRAPLPLDVRCYAEENASFPNQSSVDQFFTDDQWESYRLLGQTLASGLFRAAEPPSGS